MFKKKLEDQASMNKDLDLLLVNVGGAQKKVYQELSKDYSAIEPPFWAALTAGFIRNQGYKTDILDANAENLDFQETVEKIEKLNPKLTNIVVYGQQPAASTQLMGSVGRLTDKIKEKNPERNVILTGLHPSALPNRTMSEEKCDFVGEGEGFYTLLGLLQDAPFAQVPGLWWRKDREVSSNPRAPNVQRLTTTLSDVAWDLLPMDKYKAHNWQCLDDLDSRPRYASLSTSVGCPFVCDFCSINTTFNERRIRYWDPQWVVNQIDNLVEKYDVRNFKLIDEMFVFSPPHFNAIADGIIEKGHDINIWAYARVDTTHEKHLAKLKKAGFNWLSFGFEAGSDKVRKDVSKGKFNEKDIKEIRRKVENSGINILGNYMFGLPEDNLQSMQETLDLAQDLNCEFANFYTVMPYPGSKLYQDSVKKGLKFPKTWEGYSQHSYNCLPLPTNHISAAEVLRFRDESFNEYFTNQTYLNMVERKFGLDAKNHLENMTQVKLKRELLK